MANGWPPHGLYNEYFFEVFWGGNAWLSILFLPFPPQIFDIPKEQEINDIQNSQNQIVVEKPNLPPKKPKGKITTNDDTDTNCIDGKPPTSAKAYPAPRPPSRPPYPPRRKQVPSTG